MLIRKKIEKLPLLQQTSRGKLSVLQNCLFAESGRHPRLVWRNENMLYAFLSLVF